MTTEQALRHLDLSADHTRQARVRLAEGDLPQASLGGWLAVEVLIKAIAEQRGWRHDHHRYLWQAMQALANEIGDSDMPMEFSLAHGLYRNHAGACCDGWLDAQTVAMFLDDIEPLLEKLRRLSTPGA